MIKKKTTRNFLLWTASAICLALLAVALLFTGSFMKTSVAQAEGENDIAAKVENVETLGDDGSSLMLSFQYNGEYTTDYMTADWGNGNSAAYHWYLSDPSFGMAEEDKAKYESLNGQLAYEDKDKYNMPNAVLSKNLDAYNMGDSILIDGVPLKNYEYTLVANKWTRVHTLAIQVTNAPAIFAKASEVKIMEGCTLPTLTYSFFGEGEPSALVLDEEMTFRSRGGVWSRAYPFEGYEVGVEYDASEKFFYLRAADGNYKGHVEAPAFQFTDIFEKEYHWDDTGYVLASTGNTVKGALFVAELVNPIDANEFGLINLRFYTNYPRQLVTHNANDVTESSLGEDVELISIPGGFTTVTLMSALYANEDGMVDTLVFEFLNEGNGEQFFITSFSCGEMLLTTPVYDESFGIKDAGDYYNITFRFNKKGAFDDGVAVDTSKVSINGETLEEIGAYAEAHWSSIQGIYQINVRLDKAYDGVGQIRNADLNYAINNMSVAEGLVFPNGELLDRDYTCHIYGAERFVDYEMLSSYSEIEVLGVSCYIDTQSADNLHFSIEFDLPITSQPYYHACEHEGWRAVELPKYNLYNTNLASVFVTGGFKSSMMDSICLNGKSIGQMHAEDPYTTCVFVQYGQVNIYTIEFSVDSNSETYTKLLPLFEAGEGIELEIKEGLKFTTGYKTAKDVKFAISGDKFQKVGETSEMQVFFDGKRVNDGDLITVQTVATKESIVVEGVSSYEITESEAGNVKTFEIVSEDGQSMTFGVEQNVTAFPEAKEDGCGSTVSGGFVGAFAIMSVCAAAVMMRKKNDEK